MRIAREGDAENKCDEAGRVGGSDGDRDRSGKRFAQDYKWLIAGKRGAGDGFESGVAARRIVGIPDDDWVEFRLSCVCKIFEENARAVHAGKKDECEHGGIIRFRELR